MPELRKTVWIVEACSWISFFLGLFGLFATFHPMFQMQWYGLAAVLAIPGLLISKWYFRTASVLMLVLWAAMALSGYQDYQKWQKDDHPNKVLRKYEDGELDK
jgi:membrane protein implicated in regulation of membrane protease activity